jgi:hypothetical protein
MPGMPWLRPRGGKRCLNGPPAREQVEDDADDREDQEKMDPRSDGVHADYAEQPQNEQNDGDRPKHVLFS